MPVPDQFGRYPCTDYFGSEFAQRGYWDEACQLQVVVPAAEVEERPEQSFLVIGRSGVDGILFGYRAGQAGLWAYYPIENEYVAVAASIREMIERWESGDLKL
jgi:hypothetical protein